MSRVCKETLRQQIGHLASKGNPEFGLGMTLNEEFQLQAYRMLLDYMDKYAELQERYDLDVNPEGK
ncbi:hypothetical protein GY533_003411 [Escherichia coli]|nr:hypothetical protein [Escherichia coli]